MKTFFFISCVFLSINSLSSKAYNPLVLKGIFSGTVTDARTQLPLPGVYIFFLDVKVGTTSDRDGFFEIKNLPEGRHLIEITHVGYSTISEYIDITSDTKKDFQLNESVVENNAVIVTGTSTATQLKKVPFQVSVLKKEELIQSSSSNIIDALAKKPGVSSISSGPAVSKPVIRGLGYNRVLTINDGVRQEGQQWGDEHGIEIDQASVNKVEILKGPASLIYGSDAMAGVINIITNVPVAANSIKANVQTGFQSNNNSKLVNANVSGNINGINWNMYGSNISAADYKNAYDGRVFNSKFNQHNYGGYAGYNGGWGYSHLLISNFNLTAGVIEGERDAYGNFTKQIAWGNAIPANGTDFSSTNPQIPYQHIRHFKIATDNNLKLGKNRLSFNVGYQRNQREEFGNPDNITERALSFDLGTLTYTAHFHFPERKGWRASVGVNGMQQQNQNKGLEQLIPDYNLFDIGGYLFAQKTIRNYTFSGGVRYDDRSVNVKSLMDGTTVKSSAFSRTFSDFSGSIGMAAQLTSNLNFKVNIAKGYRAPGIPEIASNGSHEGTNRYEYGNRNLKKETSIQFEAGFDFVTEHISFSLSAFNNSFNNFIFYRKLQSVSGGDSVISMDGKKLTAFIFNQQKATLSGIEASIDFHPHPLDWLHIQNIFSLVSGRLSEKIDQSSFLPLMPAPRWITEIKSEFKKVGPNIQNLYITAELDNTFEQANIFSAYNTETRTGSYTLLNAGIGADIVSKKGTILFSLYLTGSNLADIAYQNHLSRLKYTAQNMRTGRFGVYNMGRNFGLKINVPLSFSVKSNHS